MHAIFIFLIMFEKFQYTQTNISIRALSKRGRGEFYTLCYAVLVGFLIHKYRYNQNSVGLILSLFNLELTASSIMA